MELGPLPIICDIIIEENGREADKGRHTVQNVPAVDDVISVEIDGRMTDLMVTRVHSVEHDVPAVHAVRRTIDAA